MRNGLKVHGIAFHYVRFHRIYSLKKERHFSTLHCSIWMSKKEKSFVCAWMWKSRSHRPSLFSHAHMHNVFSPRKYVRKLLIFQWILGRKRFTDWRIHDINVLWCTKYSHRTVTTIVKCAIVYSRINNWYRKTLPLGHVLISIRLP